MKYHKGGCLSYIAVFCCLTSVAIYAQPDIEVTPDSLLDTLAMGDMSTQWLTISNTGSSDLIFYAWIIGGQDNHALKYNGSYSHVRCPSSNSLNIQQSMTLEAWFYAFDWNGNRRIIQKGYDDTQYQINAHNGLFYFHVYFPGGTWLDVSAPLPSINQWHHVAGVYNYSNGNGFLYLDGILIAQANGGGTIAVTSDPLYIGIKHEWSGGGDCFYGFIDEVRIWNTARTQSEIQQYMYYELTGSEPGLAAYWNFNEGAGSTAYDKTDNANNGTLFEGVAWCDSAAPVMSSWLSVMPMFGTVPADSSMQLEATFNATSLWGGDYYQEIIIISNDPDEPEVTIPVRLHVFGTPDIAVADTLLDFGIVNVGDSATKTLTVSNVGDAWLIVNDVCSDNPVFSVDTAAFSVIPGSNHQVMVTFKPSTPGVQIGTLAITSNDPDEPTVTVALRGAAMTGVAEDGIIPGAIAISNIYPNPFRKHTNISYSCPRSSQISLRVIDASGRIVKVLKDGEINQGLHSVGWDGTNNLGMPSPTGVYFLELRTHDKTETKKLLLIK